PGAGPGRWPGEGRGRAREADDGTEPIEPAGRSDPRAQPIDRGLRRPVDRADVDAAVCPEVEAAVLVETARRGDLVARHEPDVGHPERSVDVDAAEDHAAEIEVGRHQLALLDVAEIIAEEPP